LVSIALYYDLSLRVFASWIHVITTYQHQFTQSGIQSLCKPRLQSIVIKKQSKCLAQYAMHDKTI